MLFRLWSFFLFISFWLCWVFVVVSELSLLAARRSYSLSCGAQASHCGGLFYWGAQALGHMGLLVAACRQSCCMTCTILVPWPGIEPAFPALQGGFLSTGPPWKSHRLWSFLNSFFHHLPQRANPLPRLTDFTQYILNLASFPLSTSSS